MSRFPVTISDTFGRLTKETENNVNESSFMQVQFYLYTLMLHCFYKKEKWGKDENLEHEQSAKAHWSLAERTHAGVIRGSGKEGYEACRKQQPRNQDMCKMAAYSPEDWAGCDSVREVSMAGLSHSLHESWLPFRKCYSHLLSRFRGCKSSRCWTGAAVGMLYQKTTLI